VENVRFLCVTFYILIFLFSHSLLFFKNVVIVFAHIEKFQQEVLSKKELNTIIFFCQPKT